MSNLKAAQRLLELYELRIFYAKHGYSDMSDKEKIEVDITIIKTGFEINKLRGKVVEIREQINQAYNKLRNDLIEIKDNG